MNNNEKSILYRAIIIIVFATLLIAIGGFAFNGCGYHVINSSSKIDSIINSDKKKADSIARVVEERIRQIQLQRAIVHDSIIKTKSIINNYYSTTDTIEKIRDCDSIIIQYFFLERSYLVNDSLHTLNEDEMKTAIRFLNNAIDTAQYQIKKLTSENDKLKTKLKRNRKITFVSSTVAVVEGGIIYLLIKKP